MHSQAPDPAAATRGFIREEHNNIESQHNEPDFPGSESHQFCAESAAVTATVAARVLDPMVQCAQINGAGSKVSG